MNSTVDPQRAIGALLGSAIGDALGAPLHVGPAGQFSKLFPKSALGPSTELIGGGRPGWKPGEFTDATQAALMLAESLLIHRGFDGADIFDRFRRAATSAGVVSAQPVDLLFREARQYSANQHHESAARAVRNGSLMRATTSALFAASGELADSFDLAHTQSRLTSVDPTSGWSAALYHGMIRAGTRGESALNALPALLDLVQPPHRDLRQAMLLTDEAWPDTPHNGAVWTCLAQATRVLRQATTFEDAIRRACDVAGDVPTVACLTGGLAGATFGLQSIPSRWLTLIHGRVGDVRYTSTDLQRIALQLVGVTQPEIEPDIPARGPTEIHPGVFAANILGALNSPKDCAVLSLCRVDDRFAAWPHRRGFILIDQPGANPRLGEVLSDAVAEIDAFRASGIAVVVHCWAGESRTPFVLRRWLMKNEGVDAVEATEQLAKVWPHRSLTNPEFDQLLSRS